jgi:ethanolamine utilization protein EutK
MGTINSLGLLEVRGLVTGIEAADAMLKSARVRLLRQHQVNPGLITLVVEGDMAACRASVDAGIAAASRIGEIVSQRVIGAPDRGTGDFVLELAGRSVLPFAVAGGAGAAKPVPRQPPDAAKASVTETPEQASPPPAAAAPSLAAELVGFISRSARGATWQEIGERFPDLPPGIQGQLDQAVKDGNLGKAFGRYKIVPDDKPAPAATRKKKK